MPRYKPKDVWQTHTRAL